MRFKTDGSAKKTSQISEDRLLFLGVSQHESAGASKEVSRHAAKSPTLNRAASTVGQIAERYVAAGKRTEVGAQLDIAVVP